MDFKNAEKCYAPQPVWLWNSKLNIDITTLTAERMDDCGAGGYFISAYSGLKSRFYSDEWMRNISAALDFAQSHNMSAWICDDNSSFSGSSNGAVNSRGLEFQQKFLRCETGEKTNDRTIIFADGYHFYYDVNPFYVDVLNKDVSADFIDRAYRPYMDKVTGNFSGFLCRNPQITSDGIPWSFTLPAEYKNAYGEELLDVLVELFRPVGNYKDTRSKFWGLVMRLFEENFLEPIYKWCTENNLRLSSLFSPDNSCEAFSNAFLMKKYEYTHIPCIEFKALKDVSPAKALMASSAMFQLDKKYSCAFLYSSLGHSRNFDELKHMAEQCLARGINRISPCGTANSLDGFRKRTVSTTMLPQDYRDEDNLKYNNYISRICKILTEGEAHVDTLLIHNQLEALSCFDSADNDGADALLNAFETSIAILEKKHIPFHIGDEMLIKKHAFVEGDCLVIGNNRYRTVVLPENPVLLESTTRLLSQFECGGGFITAADSLSSNDICDNENLLYTTRSFSNYKIHYFVNSSSEEFTASITKGTRLLDASTGEIFPFFGIYKFSPYESIVVIDDDTPQTTRPYNKPLKNLDISGEWQLEEISPNSLVIDKCDVYIDGALTYENENAYDVTDLICSLKRSCIAECDYVLNVKELEDDIYLACEGYDNFTLTINGTLVEQECEEPSLNELFSKINITSYLVEGENRISLSAPFSFPDSFKDNYEKAASSLSERDKLSYDTEFGPLYITGSFSVLSGGEFRRLDKNAMRYIGNFEIDRKRTQYCLSNLEQQGLPFFAGKITLSKTFNLSDTSYCIRFTPKGVRSMSAEVNGLKAESVLWSPYECDISDLLNKGDNKIKITLTNNLRNLFGPHHIPVGELYEVTPADYCRKPCIWNFNKQTPWEDNFCLTEFGIDFTE